MDVFKMLNTIRFIVNILLITFKRLTFFQRGELANCTLSEKLTQLLNYIKFSNKSIELICN